MVCTCSCLGNQGIWLRDRQVRSETLQKGITSCKSHLPWSTLGTKHLKASFLDYCWKIMECVERWWRKGLEKEILQAHCQSGHKQFHLKPSHLHNHYLLGYRSLSKKKVLVRENSKTHTIPEQNHAHFSK